MEIRTIRSRAGRNFMGGLAAAACAVTAVPAMAQDTSSETRIRKLEAEVRALQRRVFPGGDGRYFEPEISSTAPSRTTTTTPSTTAVTDILARLDALETQLQTLTARTEENANALSAMETRLAALEVTSTATSAGSTSPSASSGSSAPDNNLLAMTGNSGSSTASTGAPAGGPTPARLAAVQEIAKPQTDDAGDDEYSYGFRLWDAGFYPEAQQQLTLFVEKYPDHWRTTYGRNLLGRAYLDGGNPREAAPWFLRNYQTDRTGARAADSLLYLAETMIAMEDTERACIALAEFGETYPAIASGRLADQYQSNRRRVSCN